MNYPEGSCWKRWDLHVHTPESMGTNYGLTEKPPWEAFLEDLEALPPDIKVIGVNDYIFLDGYKKLMQEKSRGRLSNIDLLLPVIELRLDKFGGSSGHLSRVNYHIIFSDTIPPEIIEAQFLNALSRHYQISPQYNEATKEWHALPSKASLEELGKLIVASVPEEKRKEFGSPLHEGFNNLNFTLEGVSGALQHHYFREKFLTAIGKTEWSSVKWNDHSIADKKHLINSTDLVFISSTNEDHLQKARESLLKANVNSRLLDCSDAHSLSSSQETNRMGKCFTWIKADTTFRGLEHAVKEYEGRVFLGKEPPKVKRVKENSTKYIRGLTFQKSPNTPLDEIWFDGVSLKFNKDLIAIIGNKGGGKSALADTLGLLGNSKQEKSFSFLNNTRFRDPRNNKALSYSALLEWESDNETRKSLNDFVDMEEVEKVKYIPQHFLETLCNETPGGLETSFDQEVKKVIFSHVPKHDRLGHESIDEVIKDRTSAAESALAFLRMKLYKFNTLIAELEEKNKKEYKESLKKTLTAKREELLAHDGVKPIEVKKPESDATQKERMNATTEEIRQCNEKVSQLHIEIEKITEIYEKSARQIVNIEKVQGSMEVLQRQVESLRDEFVQLLDGLELDFESVVKISFETSLLDIKKEAIETKKKEMLYHLDPKNEDGLVYKTNGMSKKIHDLEIQLDEPNKAYQKYLDTLRMWSDKRAAIEGDDSSFETVKYYEKQLVDLDGLTVKISGLRNGRLEIVREIFDEISKLAGCYRELYEPVQKFISGHPLAKEKVPLVFEVSIVNSKFEGGFMEKINQRFAGSFAGIEDGRRVVKEILSRHDFNTVEGTIKFLGEIIEHLTADKRPAKLGEDRRIENQLREGFDPQDMYNFIFSLEYLQPRYVIKLGDKELHQLSPGEKGTLLLIFYLIVDQSDVPLVLDQPDENIDQETVFSLLVPCIKESKKTRQVFIVTHNPNLAVVCDAEQFVHCSIDKADKNRLTYKTGALENPYSNLKASTILEGTLAAFDNRSAKYIRSN